MQRGLCIALFVGACGPTPHPYAPQTISIDAVTKACALQLSCLAPTPPFMTGGTCVSRFEIGLASSLGDFIISATDFQRYVECAANANSCTTALDCASQHHGPSWCNSYPASRCDGDVLVGCISGWGLSLIDCGALGERCQSSGDSASCTTGHRCDTKSACGEIVLGSDITQPSGSHLFACDQTTGIQQIVDCGDVFKNGYCASGMANGAFVATCVPPTDTLCTTDVGASCSGSSAEACSLAVRYNLDCGQFGGRCVIDGSSFDCLPTDSECTPSTPDRCAGDSLQMCVNGKWSSTACSSIGFETCTANAHGAACT